MILEWSYSNWADPVSAAFCCIAGRPRWPWSGATVTGLSLFQLHSAAPLDVLGGRGVATVTGLSLFQLHSAASLDVLGGRGVELQSGGPCWYPCPDSQLDQGPRAGDDRCRQQGARDRGQHEGEQTPRADGGHALRARDGHRNHGTADDGKR